MKLRTLILLPVLVIAFAGTAVVADDVNFLKCLDNLRNSGGDINAGGTDNYGNRVEAKDATGITFIECERQCGDSQEPPDWSVFSKQFTAWLLPWLALLSQLPFGAKLRKDNIVALLLSIGSPTLATYSLILTVLNGHYIERRFQTIVYPNSYYATRILAGLQQTALRITTEDGLLASLIVLPQNDKWWVEMTRLINYEHTWTISALANITWVIVAYFFTVLDSFTDITEAINSNGQSVGSLWLWLVPTVVGWLLISPKCDADRLEEALTQSNDIACVAGTDPDNVVRISSSESGLGARRAFSFEKYCVLSSPSDESCTSPIFNYARVLPWMASVERVAEAFEAASQNAEDYTPVNKSAPWRTVDDEIKERMHPDNRRGTLDQVIDYCTPNNFWRYTVPSWYPNVTGRMFTASVIAIALQWATTGSAVMVVWFTPTTGLGCRSGSYLLYGIGSTIIWALMLTSSVLSYYSVEPRTLRYHHKTASKSQRVAAVFAFIMNRLAKILAAINAIWIVAVCIFQFLNVFDTCYCNSSVLGRGSAAYNVIAELPYSIKLSMARYWAGGITISLGSVFIFIAYVTVFINNPGIRAHPRPH